MNQFYPPFFSQGVKNEKYVKPLTSAISMYQKQNAECCYWKLLGIVITKWNGKSQKPKLMF